MDTAPASMVDWSLASVDEAVSRIRREAPEAILARTDYGFGLVVARGDLSEAFVVFCPFRQDRGFTRAFRGDLDKIIQHLNR